VNALYRSVETGTLARGDRTHGDRAHSAPDSLARTVSTLLRPSCAAPRAGDVRAWLVQRQRSEVDAGDVGPRDQPDHLPRLSALHHACDVGRRPRLATAARSAARTARCVDHRRDEFSQTGYAFGRRGASVLWRAGQDRELPSGRHRRALDRRAGVGDRRAVVLSRNRGSATPTGARWRTFRLAQPSKKSGVKR